MTEKIKITSVLKKDRKRLGLTLRKVEKLTKIPHSNISRIENGIVSNSKHLPILMKFYLNRQKDNAEIIKENQFWQTQMCGHKKPNLIQRIITKIKKFKDRKQ